MVYEGVLLFGVVAVAEAAFAITFNQRNAIYMRTEAGAWLFFVIGIYFIWCWIRGGQTLPMKTWRIRVVTKDGAPLGPWRALLRYILAWMWFVPGWAVAKFIDAQGWMLVLPTIANIAICASYSVFDKERQFLHDRFAGTRLISINRSASPKSIAEGTHN
jgi:uncharacterized RDD family membrane protein YckC